MPRPGASQLTDITYIRTQEGWLYLAVVLDLFSRQIVGWAMKPRMTAELAMVDHVAVLADRGGPGGVGIQAQTVVGTRLGGHQRIALEAAMSKPDSPTSAETF